MGLTRPTVAQLNTVVTEISDPISVLNKGSTQANVDIGLVFNRDGGVSPNVALYWNETTDSLVAALTTSTGGVNSNIAVSSYANLTVGNIVSGNASISGNVTANYFLGNGSQLSGIITSVTKIINGTSDVTAYENSNVAVSVGGTANTIVFTSSNIHVKASIIPAADITYDLGSSVRRFNKLYLSGNTIYLGNATITSVGDDVIITNSGSFGVPVGTTDQRTSIQGAIRFNTTLSKFETYDGLAWNSLAYGTLTDFPTGDYGDLTATTTDAFGVATASSFDCNAEGPVSTNDLGALT